MLGVNTGYHDAAAALMRDGELLTMVEQERISRNRHAVQESPREAIAACLGDARIGLEQVTEIAVGWDLPRLSEINDNVPFDESGFVQWLLGDLLDGGVGAPRIRYVDHHLAHAASAFYTGGMTEAAVLVIDGSGESAATTVGAAGPGGIEMLYSWGPERSLGNLYSWAADWAGMTIWDAGKLMGLAAYGESRQPAPLTTCNDGYEIPTAPPPRPPARDYFIEFGERLHESFQRENFPFARGARADVMAHADFAASVQHGLEKAVLALAALARRETGHTRLVLAGGVALNCTANGVLARSGIFEEIWIPPFPFDAGVSLGAALVADRSLRTDAARTPRLEHPFLAPASTPPSAEALDPLSRCDVSRRSGDELAEAVAELLAEGKLIGWFQGRAEVGQRALGARSILADPRNRRRLVRANQVKGREGWRPLAPAVLSERAGELFDGELPSAAEFMLAAWQVRKRARHSIPAAVHVDGSARPQTVAPGQGRYREALEAFHERTGVPAAINTSFNLAGEPIVLSPEDAIRTFLRSELDALVLDDLVAVKPQRI